jgi:integrase
LRIYKRPSKKTKSHKKGEVGFRYAVTLEGSDENGKRTRRYLGTFATKDEAKDKGRKALNNRDQGIDVVPGKMTMNALFQKFIQDAAVRNLSGTTLHGYRQIWKRVEKPIGAIPIKKLTAARLSDLYGDLARNGWEGGHGPLSVRSIRHTHALVSTVLAWGVRLQYAAFNVAERVEPPKGAHKRARPYERSDALRLIQEAAKTRYASLVIFGFETGLRRGELAGLKWSDVDAKARAATIRGAVGQVPGRTWYKATKTESVARIALSEIALEALRAQRVRQAKDKLAAGEFYRDEGFVFTPELGGSPSPGAISHAIRRIAARAGLSIRGVHAMRHSTGSWLIRAGVDIRTVAALLRHSSASTTLNVYAHELEGAQAGAVMHLLGASGNNSATKISSDDAKPL